MARATLPVCLLFVAVLAPARADEARLKDVQALQEQVQQTIARAEPSIACVLFSRSELYKKYGAAPAAQNPGKLGRFDARTVLLAIPEADEPRKRLVKGLDLANP